MISYPRPGQFFRFCDRSNCPHFAKRCIFLVTSNNEDDDYFFVMKMTPALHFCWVSYYQAKYNESVRVYKCADVANALEKVE